MAEENDKGRNTKTMEKIDSGMDETLKDILKDDSSLSNNVVTTLSAIIFDIAYNPTFNRFIEPSINIINSEAENKILPDGVTRDMCIRAIYKEGVMKFCLCTPEECKRRYSIQYQKPRTILIPTKRFVIRKVSIIS